MAAFVFDDQSTIDGSSIVDAVHTSNNSMPNSFWYGIIVVAAIIIITIVIMVMMGNSFMSRKDKDPWELIDLTCMDSNDLQPSTKDWEKIKKGGIKIVRAYLHEDCRKLLRNPCMSRRAFCPLVYGSKSVLPGAHAGITTNVLKYLRKDQELMKCLKMAMRLPRVHDAVFQARQAWVDYLYNLPARPVVLNNVQKDAEFWTLHITLHIFFGRSFFDQRDDLYNKLNTLFTVKEKLLRCPYKLKGTPSGIILSDRTTVDENMHNLINRRMEVHDILKRYASQPHRHFSFLKRVFGNYQTNSSILTQENLDTIIELLLMSMKKVGYVIAAAVKGLAKKTRWQRELSKEISKYFTDNGKSMSVLSPYGLPEKVYFTVCELIRLSKVGFTWSIRRAEERIEVCHQIFDKDTLVIPCKKYSDTVELIFGDCLDDFTPERWRDCEAFNIEEELINFGVGRFRCPAEELVRRIILEFIEAIIINFKINYTESREIALHFRHKEPLKVKTYNPALLPSWDTLNQASVSPPPTPWVPARPPTPIPSDDEAQPELITCNPPPLPSCDTLNQTSVSPPATPWVPAGPSTPINIDDEAQPGPSGIKSWFQGKSSRKYTVNSDSD